jgi:glycosyltransferase involved in cell wall biosynthesis
VRVIALRANGDRYDSQRRRVGPIVRFALGVWWHLLRYGQEYDVVHASALASVCALAIGSLARPKRFHVVLDWWEVWPWRYWRAYLGPVAGAVGWLVQRALARMPHTQITYSCLHQQRLQWSRPHRQIPVLRGLLPADASSSPPLPAEPAIIYAGRHIPEKQVQAIVPAFALVRQQIPDLRAVLFGEGPSRASTRRAVAAAGLSHAVDLPGFVPDAVVQEHLRRALCVVLLSRREGFGLIVAEAAALGVPSIVLCHPDSAAAELIEEGVNGVLCHSTRPGEIASAILRIHEAGFALRLQTLRWFAANAARLTIDGSLPTIVEAYRA